MIYFVTGDQADAIIHARMLQLTAQQAGFAVTRAPTLTPAPGSMVLLDLDSVPKEQAQAICKSCRCVAYTATGKSAPDGALAYLVRPIPIGSFTQTLRAVFAEKPPAPKAEPVADCAQAQQEDVNAKLLSCPSDSLVFSKEGVTFCGEPIRLSAREAELLRYLYDRRGEAVSREQILHDVWGYCYFGKTNEVDVYIRYLRKKLDEPFGVRMIVSARGCGYLLR